MIRTAIVYGLVDRCLDVVFGSLLRIVNAPDLPQLRVGSKFSELRVEEDDGLCSTFFNVKIVRITEMFVFFDFDRCAMHCTFNSVFSAKSFLKQMTNQFTRGRNYIEVIPVLDGKTARLTVGFANMERMRIFIESIKSFR